MIDRNKRRGDKDNGAYRDQYAVTPSAADLSLCFDKRDEPDRPSPQCLFQIALPLDGGVQNLPGGHRTNPRSGSDEQAQEKNDGPVGPYRRACRNRLFNHLEPLGPAVFFEPLPGLRLSQFCRGLAKRPL